jgi:hypothetical protein
LIKEQDLRDAIAECQGEKNPNANTCIKLAAYYTILNNMSESYSRSPEPTVYRSGSEFSEAIRGKDTHEILQIMDELLEAVAVLMPKLYRVTMDKINNL